ncbi:transposase [Streptomyces halstedii]|uniref:Transposase n=1 Tax=Streptomyces halstedii TaxID=1944 RepID=A0A6N9U6I8_STRHA|nr:transposase [Streptomyces halstedii]
MLAGILYKARTDTPWKYIPSMFGSLATLQTYWTRWRKSRFWEQAIGALAQEGSTPLLAPPPPEIKLRCLIEPQTLESECHSDRSAARGSPGALPPCPPPPRRARCPIPRCSRS